MKRIGFALAGVVGLCAVALGQSPKEEELYTQLTEGPKAKEALETVLKKPEEISALTLFMAAGEAFKQQRLEDSGFLFYAGQMRARFDRACFPPGGTGGDNPFLAIGAVSQQLGSVINPAIMAEPEKFNKSLARLKEWKPRAAADYNPGYGHVARKSEQDAHAAVKANRDEFLLRMTDLGKLLADERYFAAFRVVQAYNLSQDEKRPTEGEYESAENTMKAIEQEKKLKGVFSP